MSLCLHLWLMHDVPRFNFSRKIRLPIKWGSVPLNLLSPIGFFDEHQCFFFTFCILSNETFLFDLLMFNSFIEARPSIKSNPPTNLFSPIKKRSNQSLALSKEKNHMEKKYVTY